MPSAILIIGQSNSPAPTSGEDTTIGLTPAANTYAWNMTSGGWGTPYESSVELLNVLQQLTNKPAYGIFAGYGGSSWLPVSDIGRGHWTSPDSGSPFATAMAAVNASDAGIVAIVCVLGEQDAYLSSGVTPQMIEAAAVQVHAMFAGALRVSPAALPFLVSPIGITERTYPSGRQVADGIHAAASGKYPGILLGPDYYDLPVGTDGVHLTPIVPGGGRVLFADRIAAALAPVIGVSPAIPSSTAVVKVGTTTINIGSAGTFTIPSPGFVPKFVRLAAALGYQYASWGGVDDGTTAACIYDNGVAGEYAQAGAASIYITSGPTAIYSAKVQSFNADGSVTMVSAISGTPAGTANVIYELIG